MLIALFITYLARTGKLVQLQKIISQFSLYPAKPMLLHGSHLVKTEKIK